MIIEFDPAEDATKLAMHGLSLNVAGELDWDSALVWDDDRFRVISLRRANRREVRHYVESF